MNRQSILNRIASLIRDLDTCQKQSDPPSGAPEATKLLQRAQKALKSGPESKRGPKLKSSRFPGYDEKIKKEAERFGPLAHREWSPRENLLRVARAMDKVSHPCPKDWYGIARADGLGIWENMATSNPQKVRKVIDASLKKSD